MHDQFRKMINFENDEFDMRYWRQLDRSSNYLDSEEGND